MPTDSKTAITRLAGTQDEAGKAFLDPHHLLAATRLETLIQRAQLAPRLTMSYDPTRLRQAGSSGNGAAELAQSAAEARQRLNQLATVLPADCWNVLFDVCGLGKGLQMVETERRWPRRSAKLVLRIGLTQLASQFGIGATATGAEQHAASTWRSQRLPIVPPRDF